MIYAIGDIRGEKDKYESMLKKLHLNDKDTAFVLGDVLNVGEDGIEILQDMMYQTNIYPVLGEQEYYAKKAFEILLGSESFEEAYQKSDEDDRELLEKWNTMKSTKTTEKFLALSTEGQESIIDYLCEFNPYEEVECGGKTFVLCHNGIRNFDPEKDLEDYEEEDFLFGNTNYSEIYFSEKYLVTGHLPTVAIDKTLGGRVYTKKRHMGIDCGCGYGGKLAAVCLDKLKVYYC